MSAQPQRLYTEAWSDYALLDAGNGQKLERWGDIITIRPEIKAYFKPAWAMQEWLTQAHWRFVETGKNSGDWQALKADVPKQWQIHYQNLSFQLELTQFKHLGLFPEQRSNWDFLQQQLKPDARFLNLFAYTGAASCIARQSGAETLHVDSVKALITWANTNQQLNGLTDIKWVHEDALKFVERELKRQRQYDAILMDPPAWGLGAKGEKWKLEQKLERLIANVQLLLRPQAVLIVNTYSPSVQLTDLKQLARTYFSSKQTEVGELWMKSTTNKDLYYGNVLRVWS
jgi:23S rRNA (cytosine1962-C5)-methyltransferase